MIEAWETYWMLVPDGTTVDFILLYAQDLFSMPFTVEEL